MRRTFLSHAAIVAVYVPLRYALGMNVDWLQMGFVLALSYVLGAARLPQVPEVAARALALVRGVLVIWLARFVISGDLTISPVEISISESILMMASMLALYIGSAVPLVPFSAIIGEAGGGSRREAGGAAARFKQQLELGFLLLGTVAGLITLVAAPPAIILSVSGVIIVALGRTPLKNLYALLPLVAIVPVLVYAAGSRPAAIVIAVALMGVTLMFEVARLLWPAWNRFIISRWRVAFSSKEHTRPLALSSAIVGSALLVSILTPQTALIAATIGLLLPTLRSIFIRDFAPAGSKPDRVVQLVAVAAAVVAVIALILPGFEGQRAVIAAATVTAGGLLLLPLPVDGFLLAQVAAAAVLVSL
ncbi:MAG: hypothetical protein Q8P33_02620 [bacterium]|nr:hypothetical protein [bacterium]